MSQLAGLRREYKMHSLNEGDVLDHPVNQFHLWFQQALDAQIHEPNAMILSTVGENTRPSSRVVLLKEVDERGFIFFTNYQSRKARELSVNPAASLVFLWHELERQVRIEGKTEQISRHESEVYFHSRPRESQIGAWASPQSEQIPERKVLDENIAYWSEHFKHTPIIPIPDHWGGFRLIPDMIEFWQGRPNRLHDRLMYTPLMNGEWNIRRLAP